MYNILKVVLSFKTVLLTHKIPVRKPIFNILFNRDLNSIINFNVNKFE